MQNEVDEKFLRHAIELARRGFRGNQGGPFGAVIVKGSEIIAEGWNSVTSQNDPTAHAEINAIRKACAELGSYQLDGCIIYSSCEPCPMCLGAIYWARPDRLVFASLKSDAAAIGFDDEFIYREFEAEIGERRIPTSNLLRQESNKVFEEWQNKDDKIEY